MKYTYITAMMRRTASITIRAMAHAARPEESSPSLSIASTQASDPSLTTPLSVSWPTCTHVTIPSPAPTPRDGYVFSISVLMSAQ